MTEKEWLREGMDFRLQFLLLIRKTGQIVLVGLLGALLAGGGYFIRRFVYAPAREYEAVSRYYITFAEDRGKDYYNDYTWNDLAASDPILDYTMALLPEGYDRTEVQESVEAKIPSDVRVLTTTVTTHSQEETLAIAQATEKSICHFGGIIPEISKIEVIMDAEVKPVILDNHLAKASLLGLSAGLIAGAFIAVFRQVLDTSIYVDAEVRRRYGVPVLGRFYRGREGARTGEPAEGASREQADELNANLNYLAGGRQLLLPLDRAEYDAAAYLAKACNLALGSKAGDPEEGMRGAGQGPASKSGRIGAVSGLLPEPAVYQKLREADGVILPVRCGAGNGSRLYRILEQLEEQGCVVSGILLYEVDQRLEAQYYFGFRKS